MRERTASVHKSEILSPENVVNDEGPFRTDSSEAHAPVMPTSVAMFEG